MKRKLLLAAGAMLAAAAVSAFVYVNNEKNSMSDLFNANVEALTNSESDYEDNIWYRYDRPDGGFNCTKGGSSNCI